MQFFLRLLICSNFSAPPALPAEPRLSRSPAPDVDSSLSKSNLECAPVRLSLAMSTGLLSFLGTCMATLPSSTMDAQGGPPPPPAAAPAATYGDCTTSLSTFAAGATAPQITSETPESFYEGSIVSLQVKGQNLDPTWKILLCPKTTDTKVTQPTVSSIDAKASTKTLLKATITAVPGSPGTYSLYVADTAGKVYDSNQLLVINSSDDERYIPCSAPAGKAPTNANLQCSFSPLPYQVTYDVFGRGVANRFLAVYVIVQNKNHNLEYLLQDVRGGFPDYVVSSYDKKVPQDLSVKEEQFSARAITLRLTAAGASILTGVAGFSTNMILQDAANIIAGPVQAGLQSAIPNLSSSELTNLDQLAFSVTSTVIPKGGAVAVVAFIPSDILEPAKNSHRHLFSHPDSFSTYQGDDLKTLFRTMTVEVTGTHVQDVNPSATPTLTLFVTQLSTLAPPLNDFTAPTPIVIQGTGLDSVESVQLILNKAPNTVVAAKLQALPNASTKTVDPNVAQLVINSTPVATAGPGTYEINFILGDGKTVDTNQSITIPTPPTVTAVTYPTATPPVVGSPLVLTITGTNLITGDTVVQVCGTDSAGKLTSANGTTATYSVNVPATCTGAPLAVTVAVHSSAAGAPVSSPQTAAAK